MLALFVRQRSGKEKAAAQNKKKEEAPAPAPEPSNEEKLLGEIRDLLAKK